MALFIYLFLSLSFSLMSGVEASLQAGKWTPETEHEAGEGPQRSRLNRCSLVNHTQTHKHTNKQILLVTEVNIDCLEPCVLGRRLCAFSFPSTLVHAHCSAAHTSLNVPTWTKTDAKSTDKGRQVVLTLPELLSKQYTSAETQCPHVGEEGLHDHLLGL